MLMICAFNSHKILMENPNSSMLLTCCRVFTPNESLQEMEKLGLWCNGKFSEVYRRQKVESN